MLVITRARTSEGETQAKTTRLNLHAFADRGPEGDAVGAAALHVMVLSCFSPDCRVAVVYGICA